MPPPEDVDVILPSFGTPYSVSYSWPRTVPLPGSTLLYAEQVALLEAHDSFDENQDCLMVPDSAIARKYPELYAEQVALLEAHDRFDEDHDCLMPGVTLGRRELLNLYRVRWMTAHFASRLGRAGVYNTAELDAFTYDPLVDADMQRVMDGVRGMRRKLQILAIHRRYLNTLKLIKL
ncbi:hypothetical protein SLS54_003112, partial [Diplodia seriata]